MQPVDDAFQLDGVACAACSRERRRCACSLDVPRSDSMNGACHAQEVPPAADISQSTW